MPEVRDYKSGEILTMVKKGFNGLKLIKVPIVGPIIKHHILKALYKCSPQKINTKYATQLVQPSTKCAVGERVCNPLHPDAEFGNSVFLDE